MTFAACWELITAAIVGLPVLSDGIAPGADPFWHANLADAVKAARNHNKPIFAVLH